MRSVDQRTTGVIVVPLLIYSHALLLSIKCFLQCIMLQLGICIVHIKSPDEDLYA